MTFFFSNSDKFQDQVKKILRPLVDENDPSGKPRPTTRISKFVGAMHPTAVLEHSADANIFRYKKHTRDDSAYLFEETLFSGFTS